MSWKLNTSKVTGSSASSKRHCASTKRQEKPHFPHWRKPSRLTPTFIGTTCAKRKTGGASAARSRKMKSLCLSSSRSNNRSSCSNVSLKPGASADRRWRKKRRRWQVISCSVGKANVSAAKIRNTARSYSAQIDTVFLKMVHSVFFCSFVDPQRAVVLPVLFSQSTRA